MSDQQVLFDVLGSLQLEVRACSMQQWIAPVERANKTGLARHGGFRRKVPNGLVGCGYENADANADAQLMCRFRLEREKTRSLRFENRKRSRRKKERKDK